MGNDIKPDTINHIRMYAEFACNFSRVPKCYLANYDMSLAENISMSIKQTCAELVELYVQPKKQFEDGFYGFYHEVRECLALRCSILLKLDKYCRQGITPYLHDGYKINNKVVKFPQCILSAEDSLARYPYYKNYVAFEYAGLPCVMVRSKITNGTTLIVNGIAVYTSTMLSDGYEHNPVEEFERVFRA